VRRQKIGLSLRRRSIGSGRLSVRFRVREAAIQSDVGTQTGWSRHAGYCSQENEDGPPQIRTGQRLFHNPSPPLPFYSNRVAPVKAKRTPNLSVFSPAIFSDFCP